MTPTAAVRSILGDYVSEARCREVVVAVLRACREPSAALTEVGCDKYAEFRTPLDIFVLPHTSRRLGVSVAYRAMIDALIEEVTAEAGR